MRTMIAVLIFTILTTICWGVYGPLLAEGNAGMNKSSLRPFICVGIAYCIIAVAVPLVLLKLRGEVGGWTITGTVWSLIAGAAGALGALGVILAFRFGGNPLYVMPLIFGGAPVINTFVTMFMGRTYRQASPWFLAGLIVVITGAVTVLLFRPLPPSHGGASRAMELADWARVAASVILAAASWGVYGPVLHKGQMAMQGSRLRPFVCVGVAYFLIAVLIPGILLGLWNEQGNFTPVGSLWSLAGGTAGALGALGVILAFTFGGKPVYVMPIVFGGAPVINALVTMTQKGSWGQASPPFFAGMLLVIVGAVTVLVFAPRGHAPAHAAKAAKPAKAH
ncbi:MAG TPA: hypothetical protein VMF30_02445 [Pirellulales bacterium]|nr:hypothetical protein [Pirellulales bacterium]